MDSPINRLTNDQIDKLVIQSDRTMNSLGIEIPYAYAVELVELNWHDTFFAIRNGFFSPQVAVELAMVELMKNENSVYSVQQLALLTRKEAECRHQVIKYIEDLASHESEEAKQKTEHKLMYVLLSWIFDHKEYYCDPLRVVEIIYADFNYPHVMADFVRYMPTDQTDLGSLEVNERRLMGKWANYLMTQKNNRGTVSRLTDGNERI